MAYTEVSSKRPFTRLHSREVWGDSLPFSSFRRLFAPSLELSTAKKKKASLHPNSASPGGRPQLQKQRDYGSELIPLLICIHSSPTPSTCSQPPSLASKRLFICWMENGLNAHHFITFIPSLFVDVRHNHTLTTFDVNRSRE